MIQKQGVRLQDLLPPNLSPLAHGMIAARENVRGMPSSCAYDPWRFSQVGRSNLTVVVDRFGQVFFFDREGSLIAACFAFQDQFAAWLPDGTCYGSEALLGRRPDEDAAGIIGQALLDAWNAGETPRP